MTLSDEDFKERLTAGKIWEHKIAQILIDNGIDAVVPTDLEIKDDRDKEEFARKDKDIVVGDKVIEVKSRADTCIFTGPDDFPFSDIFLETESGWNKKEVKPDYYVIVSQQTGGVIVVPGFTRHEWNCRRVYDKRCGFASPTLVAPKKLARDMDYLIEELRPEEQDN